MDKLITRHISNNYSSYRQFIRHLIQDGISNQVFTFDNLNYELYLLNSQIYKELTKEVFDIAQGRIPNRILASHVHTSR